MISILFVYNCLSLLFLSIMVFLFKFYFRSWWQRILHHLAGTFSVHVVMTLNLKLFKWYYLNSYRSGKCRSHGFHNSELRVKFQLGYWHCSVNTKIGTLMGRAKCLQYPKILLFNQQAKESTCSHQSWTAIWKYGGISISFFRWNKQCCEF